MPIFLYISLHKLYNRLRVTQLHNTIWRCTILRKVLAILSLIAVVLAAGAAFAAEPIKIGYLAALTGDFAQYGVRINSFLYCLDLCVRINYHTNYLYLCVRIKQGATYDSF